MSQSKSNNIQKKSPNIQKKSPNIQKKSPQKQVQKKVQNKSNFFKIFAVSFSALLVIIIAVVLINGITNKSSTDSSSRASANIAANSDTGTNGDLTIQIKDISNQARFYPVEVDGTKLEVIAVKAPDGSIRTAFNTCQVCYSSGRGYYNQEGNELVCQNCGNRFGMEDVEVTRGGCNPVPIDGNNKIASDTSITIPENFLLESKSIFANWKN